MKSSSRAGAGLLRMTKVKRGSGEAVFLFQLLPQQLRGILLFSHQQQIVILFAYQPDMVTARQIYRNQALLNRVEDLFLKSGLSIRCHTIPAMMKVMRQTRRCMT
jgi:hypothetical protein